MRITHGIFEINEDGSLSQVFSDKEFIHHADAQAYLQENGDNDKNYCILPIYNTIK